MKKNWLLPATRRRPALSWMLLGFSVVTSMVAVTTRVIPVASHGGVPDDGTLWLCLYGVVSIGTATGVTVTARRFVMRWFMVARIAALCVVFAVPNPELDVNLLLASPLVAEICVYEAFPRNLRFSFAVIVLLTLLLVASGLRPHSYDFSHIGVCILGCAEFVVVISLVAVGFGLLIRYRELLVTYQDDNIRLDHAVSRLATANLGYQEYAGRAEQISMLEERKRITREIHDSIGYTMVTNIMLMEAAMDMVRRDPDEVAELISTARESAQHGLEDIRNALHLLRAQEVPGQTGTNAIAKLARLFQLSTGVDVDLEFGNLSGELPADVESVVYHFIQEALTNSFRHGKAGRVRVMFWVDRESLSVSVWDDGVGAEAINEGIGIAGMRERLAHVGGALRIQNRVDGFQIVGTIPMVMAQAASG